MKARGLIIALVTVALLAIGASGYQVLTAFSQEEPARIAGVAVDQPPPPTANDPYFDEQLLSGIPALLTSEDSPDVLIAVLDTGIDGQHKDLAGRVAGSINFSRTQTADDIHGHGTHVAGIIVNTLNANGVAADIRLLNVKVADDNGMVWASIAAKGIVWAVDNGAEVINMGFFVPSSSPALEQAIDYAWSRGVVLVAAAGNEINSVSVYPAYYPEVIAVAAIDDSGDLWSKSNDGDWVDAYAPGVKIYSTLPDNKYGYQSGTSMATAYVSAFAALDLTTATDANGNGFVNDEVASWLRSTLDAPKQEATLAEPE